VNAGEATVEGVAPELTMSGTGGVEVVAKPAVQEVPAGSTRAFVWRCRATRTGEVALAATVRGTDPRTGGAVSAAASPRSLVVYDGAEVAFSVSIPEGPIPLGEFPVTTTLENVGATDASRVTLTPPVVTFGSTADAVLVAPPAYDDTLASGAAATFTWTYRAVASGTLQLEASVSWTDASGATRTAVARSSPAVVPERVDVVAEDALGDQSAFAFVAGYRGQVVVGPSSSGDALVRMQLDGSAPERVALEFGRDTTGNLSSNTSPPYASIGLTGCVPNTQTNAQTNACGPDNEDGRGLLTSVTFAGDEWLVLGGARSLGELDYVYLSQATASPFAFSYVDIGGLLGGATRGFTAAAVAGDRLYLGFADNGGSRPYGVALLAAPPPFSSTSPGLDVVSTTQGIELGLHDAYNQAYGGAFTTISMVDAIAELNGHVYFFNDIGCLGSKTGTPATKDDFFACSPAAGIDYALSDAIDPLQQFDLGPRDRAWPQVAVWKGRLFAIRNTTFGPQLWSCDPARRGDPLLCEPADWQLVAADASFRTQLANSQLANPQVRASLLVATPTALFVGFDDPVTLFRTRVADPAIASDFTGKDGCIAGTAGCEGIGGDGLGAPGVLLRIFDAKAIATPEGRTDLFLTAGDGVAPVRLVRVSP
jgi:hypothetical protein